MKPDAAEALSDARIAAARAIHGDAVDRYLQFLQQGDPAADALVRRFEEMPRGAGFRMLLTAIDHGVETLDAPPDELRALMAEVEYVPFWVDWDRMRVASRKLTQNGLLVGLAFAAYALPHSYLAPANRSLAFTRALLDQPSHRFAQTTRFVIETFMPGGLMRHADGFKLAVLVRMMHARTRAAILADGTWDSARHGLPLNQAHMAMNTLFFSFHLMKGLSRLGVRFSKAEVDGLLLTWRYVGHLFGIDPEMVYTTEEGAERLERIAHSLEFDPDALSRDLCRAMIEAGPSFLGLTNPRQARAFVQLVYAVSRHLLGDATADRLGFPRGRWRWAVRPLIAAIRLSQAAPFLVPRQLRARSGIAFWLEASDYGAGGLMEAETPARGAADDR